MYTQEQLELLEKVEEFKVKEKLSQNEAGRIIGVSGSTLSQIKNGTYRADPQEIFNKIAKYFEVKEKAKLTYSVVEYAPTSISEQIYNVIGVCQIKGGLAVVVGDAGIGKSKAIQKFTADNPTSSFSITVNPCFSNIKSMLKLIAKRVNAGKSRLQDEMWDSILEKLSDGMLLIIDEAQFLTYGQIEALRGFSDYFSDMGQTLGIALVGNPEILFMMESRRSEFSQIISRRKIAKVYERSDIQIEDIQKLFPASADDKKAIDFLWRVSQTEQGIRGKVELYKWACQNNDCSYEGLVAVSEYTNIK